MRIELEEIKQIVDKKNELIYQRIIELLPQIIDSVELNAENELESKTKTEIIEKITQHLKNRKNVPIKIGTYEGVAWLIKQKDSNGMSLMDKLNAYIEMCPIGTDERELLINGRDRARWWYRNDPLVKNMQKILGLTEKQVDQAFIEINETSPI